MFVLRLFGGLSLESTDGPLPAAALQRRRLALLALLGLAGERGMSRDRVQLYLWPDSSAEHARHALEQLLYVTRRDLGRDAILSGPTDLRLNADAVDVDLWQFDAAVRERRWDDAAAVYAGPVLDGVYLADGVELEHIVDRERGRAAEGYRQALDTLAADAAARGDDAGAVRWWRTHAAADPFSARVALGLMRALAAAKDPAAAVQHARLYQQLVRESLGVAPDPAVDRLARELAPASTSAEGPDRRDARAATARVADLDVHDDSARAGSTPPTAGTAPAGQGAAPESMPVVITADQPMGSWRGRIAALAAIGVVAAGIMSQSARPHPSVAASPPVPAAVAERAGPDVDQVLRTADPEARRLYMHARIAWNTRSKSGLESAVIGFRRAINRDPTFAPAYAGLADSYAMLGYFGFEPPDAMFPKARAAALRAISLDSTSGDAYAALGQAMAADHQWGEAERMYRHALTLAPSDATLHQWYALLLAYLGRPREAATETGMASQLDPLSVQINNMYGAMLYDAGDVPGALRQFERTVNAEPDSAWVRKNPWVLDNYAAVLTAAGRVDDAERLLRRALRVEPNHPRLLLSLARVYIRRGDPARARREFARADTSGVQYPMYRALLHAALGEPDSAFAWLDRVRDWSLPALVALNGGPGTAVLRADPRYQRIRQRLGMPPLPPRGAADDSARQRVRRAPSSAIAANR